MRAWIAACLLAVALPGAAEVPEWFRVFTEPLTARVLLGKDVRSAEGEYLGTLRELALDLSGNRVHHALVELRGRRAAYPMHALEARRGRGDLVLERPADEIQASPRGMQLIPASVLLGTAVATGDGAARGELRDVVIDAFWGNAAFAVLALGDGLRPVPLDALRQTGGNFLLAVTGAALRALPPFSAEELEARLADREFLQRNAALAHRLTPLR